MRDVYYSLTKNRSWDPVPLQKGCMVVHAKGVYERKYSIDGHVEKHKAHIIPKVFSWVKGINYSKTFPPLLR